MSKCINLTGQHFGEWTVLARAESDKRGQAMWKCQCSCGTIKNIVGSTLRNGTSKSCGCKRTENSRENNGTFINEIGNRFGKLVVIAKDEKLSRQKHRAMWLCKCDCGNYKIASSKCLRDGKTKSCGCLISVGEENIIKFLTQQHIRFYTQYSVNINNVYYRFDFAIMKGENLYCLIEYHGLQHYDDKHLHWGKEVSVVQQRDTIKREWAKLNNIPLYEIPYWELDNIESVLTDIFKKMEEAQEIADEVNK